MTLPLANPVYLPARPLMCLSGYAWDDTLKFVALPRLDPTSAPVSVTVNGRTYVSGVDFTLTGYGSPSAVLWTGLVPITGLTRGQRYTYVATQTGAPTLTGRFRSVVDPRRPHAVAGGSCDNNTRNNNLLNAHPV